MIRVFFILFMRVIYTKNSNEYEKLVNWIRTNGGFINEKLIPIEKSIMKKEIIKQNEEILFIPNDISISIVNKRISTICRKIFGYVDGNDFNCVVYYMLIDKFNKKSFLRLITNTFLQLIKNILLFTLIPF